jgi:tetratricopeptide (TPR) repeat protein
VRYREKESAAWEDAFRIIDKHPGEEEFSKIRSRYIQDFVDSYVRAAMLYEKLGEPQKAYERLEKGARHARAHDLAFPHDDFFGRLRELIAQGKTGATLAERGSPPPRRRRRSWPILDEAEIAEMRRIDEIPYEENPTTQLWWELDRLYTKIIHLRADGKERRARPFAKQLEKVLLALRPDDNSRRMQECWALVYETRGELRMAVEYREKDIALCKKWIRIMGPLDEKPLEEVFGDYESLETKHHFTAYLYEDLGEYEKAYAHMQKAKRLAHKHGFEFSDESEDDLRWLRRQIRRKKKVQKARSWGGT